MMKNQTENQNNKQKKELNIIVELLKRKGLVAFASLALLVSLVIMGTAAWYTKINEVSGITLNVAEFNFTADYMTEEFMLNASDYYATEDNLAAPGTIGVIPIVLDSKGKTGISYSLGIDTSAMAEEFKRRIRYFYIDAQTGKEVTLNEGDTISGTFGAGGSVTEYVYWEWVYDLNEQKFYDFDNKKWITDGKYDVINADGTVETKSSGVTLQSLYIYNNIYESTKAAIDAFDDFDYNVGIGKYDSVFTSAALDKNGDPIVFTEKYMSTSSIKYDTEQKDWDIETASHTSATVSAIQFAMQSKIIITGAQADPAEQSNATMQSGNGKTQYKPISTLTGGVVTP